MLAALVALFAAGCGTPGQDESGGPGFAFLVATADGFATSHGLRYTIGGARGMTPVGPSNRTDTFHGTPYLISRAALIADDAALMIHAERVADGSGASNYDELPPADWPDAAFRSEGPTCMEVPASEVEGESDLEWLRAGGFDPAGVLEVQQYFAATPDHNDEIVVTLMARVAGCDDAAAGAAALEALRGRVSIVAGPGATPAPR